MATEQRPDLAIIDIGLPDMDGWEVLRRFKTGPNTDFFQILMLSGNFGDEINHLPNITVESLIAKPYEYDHLVKVIRAMLRAD